MNKKQVKDLSERVFWQVILTALALVIAELTKNKDFAVWIPVFSGILSAVKNLATVHVGSQDSCSVLKDMS